LVRIHEAGGAGLNILYGVHFIPSGAWNNAI
jgi:hypothetical protein